MMRRVWILSFGFMVGLGLTLAIASGSQRGWTQPISASHQLMSHQPASPPFSLEQGRDLYQTEQFSDAAQVLYQAMQNYQQQGQIKNQALVLNYLALAEYRLGNMEEAIAHLTSSLALLMPLEQTETQQQIYAQVLTTQGQLLFSQGQAAEAIERWKLAHQVYQTLHDETGMLGTAINQVQGLRALGRYRLMQAQLEDIQIQLAQYPDPQIQMVGWRSLGNSLQLAGALNQAESAFETSLAVAQLHHSPSDMAAAWLGLGNIERIRGRQKTMGAIAPRYTASRECAIANEDEVIRHYQKAVDAYRHSLALTRNPIHRSRILLNQLTLQIMLGQSPVAQTIQEIEVQLRQLPRSRFASNAYVNLAYGLICQSQQPDSAIASEDKIEALLTKAVAIATDLNDSIAESHALGTLGYLYEQTSKLEQAKTVTQQAIQRLQSIQANEIAYQWYWQMGRLLQQEYGQQQQLSTDLSDSPSLLRPQVLQAYNTAFELLRSLRQDLVALDTDTQFSFRQTIEPFYRQYADVLLQNPTPADLQQARIVIESLQLAELDNFFQDACSTAQPELLDRIADFQDPTAAILYPIMLSDRIEVIAKLPGEPDLEHVSVQVASDEVRQTLKQMYRDVKSPRAYNAPASTQQVYQWIVQPLYNQLVAHQTRTLVFVLDGPLQAVPMNALYTGEHYLIEDFAIALAPGLQLLSPRPLQDTPLTAITGGLTEARLGFAELPAVAAELDAVGTILPVKKQLLNDTFVESAIASALADSPSTIVHFATHANFSSDAANTYLLTYDKKLGVTELQALLQPHDLDVAEPIELLVLSACETAQGDERATLGLAGLAVRAGARSTLATLWKVPDAATAELISEFYRQLLAEQTENKAIALQQAQLHLLKNTPYKRPLNWAPFVLLGNWL